MAPQLALFLEGLGRPWARGAPKSLVQRGAKNVEGPLVIELVVGHRQHVDPHGLKRQAASRIVERGGRGVVNDAALALDVNGTRRGTLEIDVCQAVGFFPRAVGHQP